MWHLHARGQCYHHSHPCGLQQYHPEQGEKVGGEGEGEGPQQHHQAAGHPVQQGPSHREGQPPY